MNLNHRITLRRRGADRNELNEPIEAAWSDAGTIWANVLFQRGAEVMRADGDKSIVQVSIRIRARADIDTTMRARYRGVEYDIKSVLPDEDRSFMFLVGESVK